MTASQACADGTPISGWLSSKAAASSAMGSNACGRSASTIGWSAGSSAEPESSSAHAEVRAKARAWEWWSRAWQHVHEPECAVNERERGLMHVLETGEEVTLELGSC